MFGIEVFVQGWNETIKLDGTYTKLVDEHTWYGVINTSLIINIL